MDTSAFALFETPIEVCAIACRADLIVGVQLPEGGQEPARARLRRPFPDLVEDAPSPKVRAVIERICALLGGEPIDLSEAPLDRIN